VTPYKARTSDQKKVFTVAGHMLINKADHHGHVATVKEIKVDLEKRLLEVLHVTLPPKDQRLVYAGVELEDYTDVYKYCIPTNATIFLNPGQRKIKINARQKGSKKPVEFIVTVDDSFTIDQVKKLIKDRTDLPIAQQSLWADGIELMGPEGIPELIESQAKPDLDDADLLLHLNPIASRMDVIVVFPDGHTQQLKVKPTHKIGHFKKRLEADGVNLGSGRLTYQGTELADNKCLMEYDVPHMGLIFLNAAKFEIDVKLPVGRTVAVAVDASCTFTQVAKLLSAQFHFPRPTIRIMMTTPRHLRADGDMASEPIERLSKMKSTSVLRPQVEGWAIIDMPEDETLHELKVVRYLEAAYAGEEGPDPAAKDPLLLNPILVMQGQVLSCASTRQPLSSSSGCIVALCLCRLSCPWR
jgi:hypothetical protein